MAAHARNSHPGGNFTFLASLNPAFVPKVLVSG